jgi:hypothetical protein
MKAVTATIMAIWRVWFSTSSGSSSMTMMGAILGCGAGVGAFVVGTFPSKKFTVKNIFIWQINVFFIFSKCH